MAALLEFQAKNDFLSCFYVAIPRLTSGNEFTPRPRANIALKGIISIFIWRAFFDINLKGIISISF